MADDVNKQREINESTATQFVMVKDKSGKKFYCYVGDLKDPSSLTEEEKKFCIGDFDEEK